MAAPTDERPLTLLLLTLLAGPAPTLVATPHPHAYPTTTGRELVRHRSSCRHPRAPADEPHSAKRQSPARAEAGLRVYRKDPRVPPGPAHHDGARRSPPRVLHRAHAAQIPQKDRR